DDDTCSSDPASLHRLDSRRQKDMGRCVARQPRFVRPLDQLRGGKNGRGGEDVDVYICASHVAGYDSVITWKGRYVGYTESVGGRHPDPDLRPPSTLKDTAWLLFLEVRDLIEISGDGKQIGVLQGHKN